jgi:tetratricopeptide (TPR) repeat protein
MRRWFYNQMAAWCVLFRNRELALEYYRKMLALDPNDSLALASIAYQSAELGHRQAALAMFDRLVQMNPDDAEAHFNRGFLLQERNDHEGALAAFGRALAINPDHDRSLYGTALSLISTRRLEEALAPLKKNTRLQPMSPYGWYQLARVQHDLGHDDEAQRVLDQLAKFEPNVARQLERETGLKAGPLS